MISTKSLMNKLSLCLLGLLLCLEFPAYAADGVMEIGKRKQLFIDHKFIESAEGITLTMQPPMQPRE